MLLNISLSTSPIHPAILEFASKAHEDWREGFDSDYKKTGKPSKTRVKSNKSDGTEGNIHVPFHELHHDWKKENLAAGLAAKTAVEKFPKLEKAAEFIHNEWMKRNPKADHNAHQHVPYAKLSEDEKAKDRDQAKLMIQLLKKHTK